MTITTLTTAQVSANIISQIEAAISQTVPLLPKAFIRVTAKAVAAVVVLLYRYGGFIFLQMFVRTASTKSTTINGVSLVPLVEWGRLIGIGDPVAATNAELLIDVTVENQVGSLPANSQLLGAKNGVTYVTLTSVFLNAAVVQVAVKAVEDQAGTGGAGAIGNLDPGDVLSFVNPLANVSRDAVVDSQTITGSDAEDFEVYRQRVVNRFQARPQGGAYTDYREWATAVAGIVNAYVYTGLTPGYVEVYVEATPASSGSPDGIPTPAQLQDVYDAIQFDSGGLASRRPVSAAVTVGAITRVGFDVEVGGLNVSDPAQVQADITAAVEDYFLQREPFIVGLSVLPRLDRIQAAGVAGIVDDIVSAAGGFFEYATVELSGSPVLSYELGIGEKAKAASVTFV